MLALLQARRRVSGQVNCVLGLGGGDRRRILGAQFGVRASELNGNGWHRRSRRDCEHARRSGLARRLVG